MKIVKININNNLFLGQPDFGYHFLTQTKDLVDYIFGDVTKTNGRRKRKCTLVKRIQQQSEDDTEILEAPKKRKKVSTNAKKNSKKKSEAGNIYILYLCTHLK